MNDSIEPQKDLADETTYSVEEAEQMGAFAEEALDQKHDALSSGVAEVLPELHAVNKLYNRLRELPEA